MPASDVSQEARRNLTVADAWGGRRFLHMYRPDPEPARAVLVLQRKTVKNAARAAGCSYNYASRCLLGWQPPSAKFRAAVSVLLGLPESVLFRSAER